MRFIDARRFGTFLMVTATLITFQNCGKIGSVARYSSSSQQGSGNTSSGTNPPVTNPVVVPTPSPSASLPAPIKDLGYTMTFEDTFQNLDSISNTPTGAGFKWWNGTEQCCMVDSNGLPAVMFPTKVNGVSINPYSLQPGGGLDILLTKQNDVWYSGVLTSVDANQNGFKQKYGYFEIKAQMPKGLGVWPAFWMLSTDPAMPGEIDIFEYYGVSKGLDFRITLHDWRNGGANDNIPVTSIGPKTPDLTAAKHVYGFLWTETKMTFFFDGQQVWQVDTPAVMKQPYYVLINNGLGGYWPTDETPANTTFSVDYVRAYAAP